MTVSDRVRIVRHDKLNSISWLKHFEHAALDYHTDFINLTFFLSVLKISRSEIDAKRVAIKEIISLSGYSRSTFFRRYSCQSEFWSEMREMANNLLIEIFEEHLSGLDEMNNQHITELLSLIQDVNNQIFGFLNRQGEDPIYVKVSEAYQLCLAIEETFKRKFTKKMAKQDFHTPQVCKLLRVIMVEAFVMSNFFDFTSQEMSPAGLDKKFNNTCSKFLLM